MAQPTRSWSGDVRITCHEFCKRLKKRLSYRDKLVKWLNKTWRIGRWVKSWKWRTRRQRIQQKNPSHCGIYERVDWQCIRETYLSTEVFVSGSVDFALSKNITLLSHANRSLVSWVKHCLIQTFWELIPLRATLRSKWPQPVHVGRRLEWTISREGFELRYYLWTRLRWRKLITQTANWTILQTMIEDLLPQITCWSSSFKRSVESSELCCRTILWKSWMSLDLKDIRQKIFRKSK